MSENYVHTFVVFLMSELAAYLQKTVIFLAGKKTLKREYIVSLDNHIYNSSYNFFNYLGFAGGGAGPPAPPRGRGRGPMTREEAQRLREEELAGQGHGKDCFIIPQANLDRFLPDGVTVSVFLTIYFNTLFFDV